MNISGVSDQIEKRIILHAPISQVWSALTHAADWSQWFGVCLKGDFVVGNPITGSFEIEFDENAIEEHQKNLGLSPSKIRKLDKNFVFCTVERMDPERFFSFRWIPYGIDADIDLKNEPTTLVEFHLEKAEAGTQFTVVESGFNRVPSHRRERAFRMNESGWAAQCENLKKYVEREKRL